MAITITHVQQAPRERVFGRGWAAPVAKTRRLPASVYVTAASAAVLATAWSARTHSMLLYGDARAHLNVARHVTDGLRPGLSQLGSVWLPIPHLLLVPFTMFRPLWHSGAAGALVGGICFIYAATRLFALVEDLTANRVAAWCAFGLFVANANLLYMQSTALTEPVLLAVLIGATFHFSQWMRTLSVRSLILAATFTFAATLTRYEGWALLAAGILCVIAWSKLADRRWKSPQANLVLYTVIAGYGILLWLLYNLVIFGDALYFLHGKYSAAGINTYHAELAGTKGSIVRSTLTYAWDVLDIVGPAFVIAAVVAAVIVLLHAHPERSRSAFVLALLFAPVAFEVVSLYLGQTTIRVPELAPHGMWNDRYGLIALPFCAVAVGLLVARKRVLGIVATVAGAIALVAVAAGTPLALADGRTGTSSATAGRPEHAAAYLHDHYQGGEVLADDSATSAFMFAADLDLKEFVSPGFHPYWERALTDPSAHVRWAVASAGDAVTADLTAHPDRFGAFRMVFDDGTVKVYQRASETGP